MIPFLDLKREHDPLREEIHKKIEEVIYGRSSFMLGEEVEKFEMEFADFCGREYAIGVNSGTDALELALLSLDIRQGDEVILPVNTAIPTAFFQNNSANH